MRDTPFLDRRTILGALGGLAAACWPLGGSAATGPDLAVASRRETGLRIYSNMADYNWREILGGFRRRYPWIDVETLDMGPTEVFERYYAETSARRRSADMIVSSAPDAWLRFLGRRGAAPYRSPQAAHLPAWSLPAPGLYTLSADPMLIVYNKALLDPAQRPTGLRQLLTLAQANPRKFRNRITTYDASSHALAYAVHWTAIQQKRPGGWDLMQRIAPYVRVETGGATMMDKVTVGEYLVGYHVSAVTVLPQMLTRGRAKIVDWTLCADGTPVVLRGMAATAAAQSPASARLMLDYLLSREGQIAAAKGGLTPYRPDVREHEVPFLTHDAVVRRVGAANVVLVGYDPRMVAGYAAFIKGWNALFHRRRS
ncbi:ABC transporter substrate-binding protein [Sphingobium aquiterrae]|uniref:ABC transporter substrate-binding protein n=1 Tax=Sphingobium aquiterrae TaxID=2038656 RepID=UPI0030199B86